MATNRRKVGALIFPGFELLDLFGPLEMLGMLPDHYDLHLVAQTSGPVQSNQQVSAYATSDLTDEPDFDILFVPGGAGTRLGVSDTVLLEWIMRASDVAEFTVSVCTGSALLAKAGVLDGRRATTNKLAFDWVMLQGPKVNWIRRARWVQDDQFVRLCCTNRVKCVLPLSPDGLILRALLQGCQELCNGLARRCGFGSPRPAGRSPTP